MASEIRKCRKIGNSVCMHRLTRGRYSRSSQITDAMVEHEYGGPSPSDVLAERSARKDKPIGQSLDVGFSLDGALDAAADVFNGVSCPLVGLSW